MNFNRDCWTFFIRMRQQILFTAAFVGMFVASVTANAQINDALILEFPDGSDSFQQTDPQAVFNESSGTEHLPQTLPHDSSGIVSIPELADGCAGERIHLHEAPEKDSRRLNYLTLMTEPYSAYRTEQNTLAWLPGTGKGFGWLDWQTDGYLRRGQTSGLTGAINVHWISGPLVIDIPARVYDFNLGYQMRKSFSELLSYDVAASVGVYSDFESSAREGVRFPAHAVGMLHLNPATDLVFGFDYLDRDDLHVLPVIGLSLRNVLSDRLRLDLVFPRPRIDYRLSESHRMYLAGQLGGGTWDIEYPDKSEDVMTYRDYRVLLGFEMADNDGSQSAWEFGFVTGRRLELRGLPQNSDFDNAFVIQWVSRR